MLITLSEKRIGKSCKTIFLSFTLQKTIKHQTMKNYFDLTGYVAVVTGASAGLGLQMAKAYASQGANLVLIARRQNLLEENAFLYQETSQINPSLNK